MPDHPLSEVFGFPYDNLSERAERYRNLTLCPYNNKVPSCTKNSAEDPLGVCSIFDGEKRVITCPVRFREDWRIIEDAARFFFPAGCKFTSLSEVRLKDADGNVAGGIDFVLVSVDDGGKILDFGALEVQSVYISGNVTKPFEHYMETRQQDPDFRWRGYVRPDYLSSSRKRLVPQLLYKGAILQEWGKKIAVTLQDCFYATLPKLPVVDAEQAEIGWLTYSLDLSEDENLCHLVPKETEYTSFRQAMDTITTPRAGKVEDFIQELQDQMDNEKFIYPPVNLTLLDLPSSGEEE
jgi:hypothetical protein